jgi:cell division protein FtsA
MLTGLRDLAVDVTGLPARIGFPSGVGGLAETVSAPSFATGVGLVIWGGRTRIGTLRRESGSGMLGALFSWVRRILRDVQGN